MQVAVAGVRDGRDLDAVARADLLDRAEHLGQARPGHGDVLDEHLARCGERRVHGSPDGEESLARRGIRRQRHPAACTGERLGDPSGLGCGAVGVALGEQERLAGSDRLERGARERLGAQVRRDPAECGRVDELEHRGPQPCRGDGGGRGGGRLDVGERRGHGDDLARR